MHETLRIKSLLMPHTTTLQHKVSAERTEKNDLDNHLD